MGMVWQIILCYLCCINFVYAEQVMGNSRSYLRWWSSAIEHWALRIDDWIRKHKWAVPLYYMCPHPLSLSRHTCYTHRKHLIFISHAPFHHPYPLFHNSSSILSPSSLSPIACPLLHLSNLVLQKLTSIYF